LSSWSSSRSFRSEFRSKRLRLQDTLAAFKFGFFNIFFQHWIIFQSIICNLIVREEG
jgi:hypothetical protein